MADSKISALTDGNPAQSGDEIPIARSGANYKITVGSITSLTGDVSGADTISTDNAVARFDGTTGKLIQNSGVTIDDSNNLTLPGQADLRFADSDSSNWVAFQAPSTVSSNVTWTLPSADGTSGQVLSTDGAGTLSWATGGGGGGGLSWQSVQTTGFTAVAGRAYPCNTTSAAFTVTLPASPAAGNVITLTDYAGTWGTNNLTVNPNGGKANGSTNNFVLNLSRFSAQLVYIDSTQGWVMYGSANLSNLTVPAVDYLVVAGGGGGGGQIGGGGGAGGYRTGSLSVNAGASLTVTVGGGGGGGAGTNKGSTGSNSVFSTITSAGGGGGGADLTNAGLSGGSGGGGGRGTAGASGNTPSTSPSQGNNGGTGAAEASGGGGGSGSVGGNATVSSGGTGGSGTSSSISGSSVTYAGGGGGGGYAANGTSGGTGGSGGGGNGTNNGLGGAGVVNTGGGGGGGGFPGANGGAGGSGVVIISYPTFYAAATATTGSPTVTVSGANRIYRWTGNGSITF